MVRFRSTWLVAVVALGLGVTACKKSDDAPKKDPANDKVAELTDLNPRETLVLGVLAVAVLFMGVYPLPFTEVMHASVNDLLRHVLLPKH